MARMLYHTHMLTFSEARAATLAICTLEGQSSPRALISRSSTNRGAPPEGSMAPRKRKSGKRVGKTKKTGAEVGCQPRVVGKVGTTANVADTGVKRRRRRKREDDECKGLLKNNNSGSVGASVVLLPGQRLTTDDGEKLERAVLCATASTNGRAQVAEKLLAQVEAAAA